MMESLDDERKRKVESTEAASDSAKRSNAVYSSFFSQGMMMGEGLGDERKRKVESTEVSDSKRSNTEYSSFSQGMMMGEGLGDERKRKIESTEVPDSKRSNTEYSSFSQGMMMGVGLGDKRKRKVESIEVPVPKCSNAVYSSFSQRMMANMGYVPGKGLGKMSSGITEPLEESLHKGRRGLGFDLDGLEKEDVQWELEEVNCNEEPMWMDPCTEPVLQEHHMFNWIVDGKRKSTIADEVSFCDGSILRKLLDSKTIFDKLGDKEFLDARQRANPFETIRGGIFQNRAAMKMANIDAVFDFMFTSPKNPHGNSKLLGVNDVLYFADICAGPGGFSEYVLWKKEWRTKGFGITLRDPESGSDFKLDNFTAGPCEGFDPHYGELGDGDVTKSKNLDSFSQYVRDNTQGQGVHFAMADGGISVEGQENIQEILTKRLVLCQYLFALSVVRTGGHFVCKVFDMFTPFSVGLFYLLYRSFERVCIFKPVTSRPANSERYIVCKNLLPNSEAVTFYLRAVNEHLDELSGSESDVIEIVPMNLLNKEPFKAYITEWNDRVGLNQMIALKKLRYYVQNSNLQDTRQNSVRMECFELWQVPDHPRMDINERPAKDIFTDAWKSQGQPLDDSCMISSNFHCVSSDSIPFLTDVHSWKWYFACGKRYYIVGLGRNKIKCWNCQGSFQFSQVHDFNLFEVPRGTVLEVEIVPERTGEGAGQKSKNVIYIIDVLAVYGESFTSKPLKERLDVAEVLCKTLNKPSKRGFLQIKVKPYLRLKEMEKQFDNLTIRKCKALGDMATIEISEDTFITPHGVIFCKVLKYPWQLHVSKIGKFYFFNTKTNKSSFDPPQDSVASYMTVVKSRHIWKWEREIYKDLCGIETHLKTSELSWSIFKRKLNPALSNS